LFKLVNCIWQLLNLNSKHPSRHTSGVQRSREICLDRSLHFTAFQ